MASDAPPPARRVAVAGAGGKVGTVVCAGVEHASDLELVARIGPQGRGGDWFASVEDALAAWDVEILVDFTRPDVVEPNVRRALGAGVPVVFGTTGLDEAAHARIDVAARDAGLAAFFAPNFAVTAVLMMRFAQEAARLLPDCAIVEEHAATKRDRPSGTALHTAALVEAASGRRPEISAVRLPGLVAHQSVIFGTLGQTLTIRHDTSSREAFVPGVLRALRAIDQLPPGLTVGLEALL